MNVLFTTRKGIGHLFEKKPVKGFARKGRLTDAKIDTLQNYFDIAFHLCKASMFHVDGYHDSCPKKQNSTGQIEWNQYL